jgi:hypothetical protein
MMSIACVERYCREADKDQDDSQGQIPTIKKRAISWSYLLRHFLSLFYRDFFSFGVDNAI